ncbi:MAG: MBL fold metallo-hydrolase [Phycisphaeraceae bacterium]|nr:MBL fold metallo-hydrolase [Phycisphaeraceae bacterium]
MDYRIISIGCLSIHELWKQDVGGRSSHATTTLIRSQNRVIIVDPGLPAPALTARLAERVGLAASEVTDVFLTTFLPAHRRGLEAFDQANWWIAEMEREAIGQHLVARFEEADDEESRAMLRNEIQILRKFKAAPDRLADQVDLFPLPGFTPGTCGLLLLSPRSTTLLAGDAVATGEHLEQGRILKGARDTAQARESLQEAIEIADAIIPGHDNILVNPMRQGGP